MYIFKIQSKPQIWHRERDVGIKRPRIWSSYDYYTKGFSRKSELWARIGE